MPLNFSVKEVYDICEYGYFDVIGDFHCPFRNEKMLDVLTLEQSVTRYSHCPKVYSDSGVVCYKVRKGEAE